MTGVPDGTGERKNPRSNKISQPAERRTLRQSLTAFLHALLADERGLSTVEYALVLALIALAALVAFVGLGDRMGVVLGTTSRDIGAGPSS